MELWTALFLGFVGSFHCVGMCGPIAMSIPRSSSQFLVLTNHAIIYNSGRILVYAFLGLLFGLLGTQITIAGFQGWISILLGVGIIVTVIMNQFFKNRQKPALFDYFAQKISTYYGLLLRKESILALFGMGVLNGLLPCAFVYSGLAVAVLTESPSHSTMYMTLFGLGTFPAMYFMYLAPSILSLDLRNSIRKLVPYLALSLGLFLIVRGIALQDLYLPRIIAESVESFCVFPGTN